MHTSHGSKWPQFELMWFPEPVEFPRVLAVPLLDQGAPKDMLGRYRSATSLKLMNHPRIGQAVCFGVSMLTDSVCLNPRTGEVLLVTTPAEGPIWLVNSSLAQFNASVRAVYDRFPFEHPQTGEDIEPSDVDLEIADREWDQAAADLERTLATIDTRSVVEPNGFWMTFLDDVRAGDFSTDLIVGQTGA
jgi:hypothetical protein